MSNSEDFTNRTLLYNEPEQGDIILNISYNDKLPENNNIKDFPSPFVRFKIGGFDYVLNPPIPFNFNKGEIIYLNAVLNKYNIYKCTFIKTRSYNQISTLNSEFVDHNQEYSNPSINNPELNVANTLKFTTFCTNITTYIRNKLNFDGLYKLKNKINLFYFNTKLNDSDKSNYDKQEKLFIKVLNDISDALQKDEINTDEKDLIEEFLCLLYMNYYINCDIKQYTYNNQDKGVLSNILRTIKDKNSSGNNYNLEKYLNDNYSIDLSLFFKFYESKFLEISKNISEHFFQIIKGDKIIKFINYVYYDLNYYNYVQIFDNVGEYQIIKFYEESIYYEDILNSDETNITYLPLDKSDNTPFKIIPEEKIKKAEKFIFFGQYGDIKKIIDYYMNQQNIDTIKLNDEHIFTFVPEYEEEKTFESESNHAIISESDHAIIPESESESETNNSDATISELDNNDTTETEIVTKRETEIGTKIVTERETEQLNLTEEKIVEIANKYNELINGKIIIFIKHKILLINKLVNDKIKFEKDLFERIDKIKNSTESVDPSDIILFFLIVKYLKRTIEDYHGIVKISEESKKILNKMNIDSYLTDLDAIYSTFVIILLLRIKFKVQIKNRLDINDLTCNLTNIDANQQLKIKDFVVDLLGNQTNFLTDFKIYNWLCRLCWYIIRKYSFPDIKTFINNQKITVDNFYEELGNDTYIQQILRIAMYINYFIENIINIRKICRRKDIPDFKSSDKDEEFKEKIPNMIREKILTDRIFFEYSKPLNLDILTDRIFFEYSKPLNLDILIDNNEDLKCLEYLKRFFDISDDTNMSDPF